MFNQEYQKFVRPDCCTHASVVNNKNVNTISGDEAQRLYLEEINTKNNPKTINYSYDNTTEITVTTKRHNQVELKLPDNALFLKVQNNDVQTLKAVLDHCPDKISLKDEYDWSLLMIACQANSIDCVKELLNRGIDINIRDRAGNSARSLVIRNKNVILANMLLDYTENSKQQIKKSNTLFENKNKVKTKEQYVCKICNNNLYPDRIEHLSSIVHNINASKTIKIPTNYMIPPSNKGFQILVKSGWDKETGLGPNGTGRKLPIKSTPKYDRMGLGHKSKKLENNKNVSINAYSKNVHINNYKKHKQMEIEFRRQFY